MTFVFPFHVFQAECEELQKSVQGLTNENHGLKDELQRLSQECEKLASENTSIKVFSMTDCELFFLYLYREC